MAVAQKNLRKALAGISVSASVVLIGIIFWQHELKYSLPTPVPVQYVEVKPGEEVHLPSILQQNIAYFFHFYNPECPCSRFNARHIKSLIGTYHDSVRFIIVVPAIASLENARKEFGDDQTYLHDENQLIAKACGVYSTPQAAIVSSDGKLFYRGNYNATRYCTSRASNYAELSLIALLQKRTAPVFGIASTQSYGCELNADRIEFF